MKKVMLSLAILTMTFFVAYAAVEPSVVNLKEAWEVKGNQRAVMFNHELHSEKNPCTDCHETEEGGKWKPAGEIKGNNQSNPAHNMCWTTCHAELKVVGKVCTKCHTGDK